MAILINMQVCQKAALITVGTTEFDELLEKIDTPTFADVLLKFGYNKLVIQRGRGNYKFGRLFLREEDEFQSHLQGGLLISVMRFHPDLVEIIHQSDLVIGHAGAGTVLEVAKAKKVSLIVVNPTLQDNHQEDLARAIQSIGSDKCMIGHLDDILSPLQILLMNNHNRHAFVQDGIIFPILDSRNFASMLSEMVEVDE